MSYDNFAQTFSKSRKNHPWPELEYIIHNMGLQGYRSILDIGCGNGRFIEESQKMNFIPDKYLGIDNSKGMIHEAQQIHPESHFKAIGMQEIDQINDGFDAILFLASFHHLATIEERFQVLQNTKRLLNPNGRIYMTNWNLLEQERYQKSHRGNGEFDIKIGEFSRYYHGFTINELSGLFTQTNYQIIENRIFEGGRNILSVLSV